MNQICTIRNVKAKIETDIWVDRAPSVAITSTSNLCVSQRGLFDLELALVKLQVQLPVSTFFKSLTSIMHDPSFWCILPIPFLHKLTEFSGIQYVLQDFPLLSCVNSHVYHSTFPTHESSIVSPLVADTLVDFGSLIRIARVVANKTRKMDNDFILRLTLKMLIVSYVLSCYNGKRIKFPENLDSCRSQHPALAVKPNTPNTIKTALLIQNQRNINVRHFFYFEKNRSGRSNIDLHVVRT